MRSSVIAKITTSGGTGHFVEFVGSAIRSLSMEARMTLCNMSIESGARGGMIAPDETTFAYLKGREEAPKGAAWDQKWRSGKNSRQMKMLFSTLEYTFDAADIPF